MCPFVQYGFQFLSDCFLLIFIIKWLLVLKDDVNTPAIFCRYPFLLTLLHKVAVFNFCAATVKVERAFRFHLFNHLQLHRNWFLSFSRFPSNWVFFALTECASICSSSSFGARSTARPRLSTCPSLPANPEANSPGRGHLQTAQCSRPLCIPKGAFSKYETLLLLDC